VRYSSFPHNKKAEKKRKKRTANAVRPLARYGVNLCPYEHYPKGFGDFLFVRICLFLSLKIVKVWGYLEVF